jgi:RimJ/RimL family protein N-acetyltransferase
MPWLPMHTARLVLRRFEEGDLAAFQAYRQDPELSRYQGWQPLPDEAALRFLREQASAELGARGQWLQVALVQRLGGLLVGDLGLCVRDEALGVLEIGFTLVRSAHGHGLASEAVRAVLAVLFGGGHARTAIAVTDARNRPSIALLERVGFRWVRTVDTLFRNEACREHTFVMAAAAAGSAGGAA